MCTSLAGAAGGTVTACLVRATSASRSWEVAAMCNGILAGLVSVTAGSATIATWAAVLVGGVGGFVYSLASRLVLSAGVPRRPPEA